MRLDPALQEPGRNRELDRTSVTSFELHARKPAGINIVSHRGAKPILYPCPSLLIRVRHLLGLFYGLERTREGTRAAGECVVPRRRGWRTGWLRAALGQIGPADQIGASASRRGGPMSRTENSSRERCKLLVDCTDDPSSSCHNTPVHRRRLARGFCISDASSIQTTFCAAVSVKL